MLPREPSRRPTNGSRAMPVCVSLCVCARACVRACVCVLKRAHKSVWSFGGECVCGSPAMTSKAVPRPLHGCQVWELMNWAP
eukprot:1156964-Pelagomonas_calceolata.AAC.8